MLGKIWPSGTGVLATAVTAAGFHATPFWTAVFSVSVGATVSVVGFVLQYRYRNADRTKDALLVDRDHIIKLQQDTILMLHRQIAGEKPVTVKGFIVGQSLGDTSGGDGAV